MNESRNLKTEEIIELLFYLIPHIRIIRHIPGRLKVEVTLSAVLVVEKVDLQGLLLAIPGILNARMGLFVDSLIIEYDHEILPYEIWEFLIRSEREPELRPLVRSRLKRILDTNHE